MRTCRPKRRGSMVCPWLPLTCCCMVRIVGSDSTRYPNSRDRLNQIFLDGPRRPWLCRNDGPRLRRPPSSSIQARQRSNWSVRDRGFVSASASSRAGFAIVRPRYDRTFSTGFRLRQTSHMNGAANVHVSNCHERCWLPREPCVEVLADVELPTPVPGRRYLRLSQSGRC